MQERVLMTSEDITTENWKDVELEGRLLVLKTESLSESYRDAKYQLVLACGGFGCRPDARGNAIFIMECHTDNPERYRRERYNNDFLGFPTEKAITEWKEIYGKFNNEVLKELNKICI